MRWINIAFFIMSIVMGGAMFGMGYMLVGVSHMVFAFGFFINALYIKNIKEK